MGPTEMAALSSTLTALALLSGPPVRWTVVDETTIIARFHNINHKIEYKKIEDGYYVGTVVEPVRNPPTKVTFGEPSSPPPSTAKPSLSKPEWSQISGKLGNRSLWTVIPFAGVNRVTFIARGQFDRWQVAKTTGWTEVRVRVWQRSFTASTGTTTSTTRPIRRASGLTFQASSSRWTLTETPFAV